MKDAIKRQIKKGRASATSGSPLDRALVAPYRGYRNLVERLRNSTSQPASKLYLRGRNLKRNLRGRQLKFVSVESATIWTLDWVKSFPHGYDLIVGIPRSGLFIASLIAVKLGRPLTTPDLLQQGKFWHSKKVKNRPDIRQIDRLLLVDDSIDSGRTMDEAIDTIRAVNPDVEIARAGLIVREEARALADLYHQIVSPPRVFEWNLLHRKLGSHMEHGCLAVDLDGVLCADTLETADEDETAYLERLRSARRYLVPAFEIDCVITGRSENYRPQTEAWLSENGVRYKELIMRDLPSIKGSDDQFARYRIDRLLRLKPDMMWASNWDEAQSIWRETRIPTLCTDRMTLLS